MLPAHSVSLASFPTLRYVLSSILPNCTRQHGFHLTDWGFEMGAMYFKSRAEVGRKLATMLKQYANQNVAVVALNEGGVIVGAQIAMQLHANLMLMLTENIYLPGEPDAIASLSSTGSFTYNNMFSTGQLEDWATEFHGFIDQQRMEKMHHMNKLVGRDGEIHKEFLRHHIVIIVSDGLSSGFSLDIAAEFIKTVAIKRLIIATPLASVSAVDRMHLLGDEICCLSVPANYMNTNHYYEDNTIPSIEHLFKIIKSIVLNWHHE